MVNRKELDNYCNEYLNVTAFKDYCSNGLQIEGTENITSIVSGVSANLALIERAIDEKADAIFVHHGIFWKDEDQTITGAKRRKVSLLLSHNINLFGYHLPLDAHPEVGNNVQLGKLLDIQNMKPVEGSLLWQGDLNISLSDFTSRIEQKLERVPQVFGNQEEKIRRVSWCTGGAQNYIDEAITLDVGLYLSGEVSEKTPAAALENNLTYIAAGHHATERYGIQALCEHLSKTFQLQHQYLEIDNPV
jgi:dinuclear metal center YbgI/SA1388 family protein